MNYPPHRSRSPAAALASALVVAAGFAALMHGLDLRLPAERPRPALVSVVTMPEISVPPPPPPTLPAQPAAPAQARPDPKAAAPVPVGSKGAQVVVPPVPLVLAPPLPITTAPLAGSGGMGSNGTGTGAGGTGQGEGSGGGTGGGGGGGGSNAGVATLPRQVSGRMLYSDLPPDLRKARDGAEITVRYRIGVDGLVSGCTVIATSGRPDLDAATCAHITRRFRFRPARDAAGSPVPFVMTETQGWNNAAQ